jgi:hypothetical protein
MIIAIIEASPRSDKTKVSKFRKHKMESGKLFLLDDIVRHDAQYKEARRKEEEEKKAKAQARKETAEANRQMKVDQKKQREEARQDKKRKQEQENQQKAKRARQASCSYCTAKWKGSSQWLWCDDCDDVGICPHCQKDNITLNSFQTHEESHKNQ